MVPPNCGPRPPGKIPAEILNIWFQLTVILSCYIAMFIYLVLCNVIWQIASYDRWRHPQRCYEAVRSATLATAWLLVEIFGSKRIGSLTITKFDLSWCHRSRDHSTHLNIGHFQSIPYTTLPVGYSNFCFRTHRLAVVTTCSFSDQEYLTRYFSYIAPPQDP